MKNKLKQALLDGGYYYDASLVNEPWKTFLESLLVLIATDIRQIQQISPDISLPEPGIAFTSDLTLNAFATKIGDEYCIGVNIGTVFLMNDIFNKILSSKNTFPNYGDPSLEKGIPQGVNPHIVDAGALLSADSTAKGDVPTDPIRADVASILTILAIRFLALHEYGHIVNGHVDYGQSLRQGFRFDENSHSNQQEVITPLDLQTLELDADAFATKFGLHLVLIADKYEGYPFKFLAKDLKEAVNLWSTAAHVVFRLLAEYRVDSSCLADNTYPVPGARILNHKGLVAELLKDHIRPDIRKSIGVENASYIELLTMGMEQFKWIESAFLEMDPSLAQHSLDLYDDLTTEPFIENQRARNRNWVSLRPRLIPYAKMRLAPPVV